MRQALFLFCLIGVQLICKGQELIYQPNWESLSNYQCPEWFRDAKFGIFIHWGVISVPEHANDWYGFNMYRKNVTSAKGVESPRANPIYAYHQKEFGDQATFGYKDFIPSFKAEKFDPAAWIDLFEMAGAKYVVPVGEHCDGFAMYASSHTRWNAAEMNPKRDILGELAIEARKKGLKFGTSSHLAYGWYWWGYEEGFDTTDPQYEDLYHRPHKFSEKPDKEFLELYRKRVFEMIDKYQLDLMWFDFGFCAPEYEDNRLKILSHYYNRGLEWNKGVVLNYKRMNWVPIPDGTAVLDLERGKLDRIRKLPWQTDTSIGRNSWAYINGWISKPAGELIDELVDIVSKNGNLLLNVGPKSDGTIPEDQKDILLEIGEWLSINGEGIYNTRPWTMYGEGPSRSKTGDHTEYNTTKMTSEDIRYTTNENNIYAFVMDIPSKPVMLKAFSTSLTTISDEIFQVSILGGEQGLKWERNEKGLIVNIPKQLPNKHVLTLKITLKAPPENVYKSN